MTKEEFAARAEELRGPLYRVACAYLCREQDRLEAEQEAFFYRVQEGYQKLAEHFPERIRRLDGSLDREEIRERIVGFVKDMLDRRDAADCGEMADFPADGEA